MPKVQMQTVAGLIKEIRNAATPSGMCQTCLSCGYLMLNGLMDDSTTLGQIIISSLASEDWTYL